MLILRPKHYVEYIRRVSSAIQGDDWELSDFDDHFLTLAFYVEADDMSKEEKAAFKKNISAVLSMTDEELKDFVAARIDPEQFTPENCMALIENMGPG